MPSFPDFKGRNPSGNEMPRVAGGDQLRPRDINRLATGIDRTTLRATVGGGFRIKRSDGGTSITAKDNVSQYHWRCTRDHNHIHINIGDVWGLGVANRAKKQILTNVNYDAMDEEDRYYKGCPDIMIGIANATHLAASLLKPNERLYVPAKKGVYYIKYMPWTGQPAGSSTPQDSDINDLKGTMQVCLMFSESPDSIKYDQEVYPICEVDDDGVLWQGIDCPIFIRPPFPHNFKVYIIDTGSEYRVTIGRGHICNVVPVYDGTETELGEPNKEDGYLTLGGSPSKGVYSVLIECEAEANDYQIHFPKKAEAKIKKGYNPIAQPDTETKANLRIADITVEVNSQTGERSIYVNQFVYNSVWAERQKWNDGLIYYYYGIG